MPCNALDGIALHKIALHCNYIALYCIVLYNHLLSIKLNFRVRVLLKVHLTSLFFLYSDVIYGFWTRLEQMLSLTTPSTRACRKNLKLNGQMLMCIYDR